MPKKQKTKFKFICPVFRVEVILALGDMKKIKEFSADYSLHEDSIGECLLITSEDDTPRGFVIWIKDKIDYNSMVHETLHLVKRIFQIKGVPFNSDNDEIIAYYQNYWVRKFWNKMSKFIED